MIKRQGATFALAIAVILAVGFTWNDSQPTTVPMSLASKVTSVRLETHLPGRTYLNGAQLQQAYRSGQLDRPIKSLLAIDEPLEHGEYRWDDEGVAEGPTWVRVDLNSQILSVFRGGHEIGTAVILYGAQSKETPPGVYPIMAKAREHRSSLYDADMPFTLRLTNDGISIHGSDVRWGAATHGCIGVPLPFAEKLFDAVAKNDEVTVLRRPPTEAAGARS